MDNTDIEFIPLEKADLELVRNWRNSPDVSKYMYSGDYISPEQQENWFRKINSDPAQKYWLFAENGKKLGLVSVYNINSKFQTCHWAFYIGDPMGRKKGIGSKVEFKLLDYVFNELKMNKLIGEVLSFNTSVISMHEKFGFRREGYLREHIMKDGVFHDVVCIGLLRSEWEYLREYNYNRIYCQEEIQ